MNKIGFWKVGSPYGEFSNWYSCNFVYGGVEFTSSEQALMYFKAKLFKDEEVASKILKEQNQRKIKDLGRQVKNYDETKWSAIRYNCMVDILYCKFSQNEDLKNILIGTGDASIYEASPLDHIWGIGSDNVNIIKGQNLLGEALMAVRTIIKQKEKNNGN